MPYIHIQTNASINKEQKDDMKKALGEAITLLGKSENWLMLRFEDNCDMAFRGQSGSPLAFVGVSLYGKGVNLNPFTEKVTGILNGTLGIDPAGIYIRYLSTMDWGWNGSNF